MRLMYLSRQGRGSLLMSLRMRLRVLLLLVLRGRLLVLLLLLLLLLLVWLLMILPMSRFRGWLMGLMRLSVRLVPCLLVRSLIYQVGITWLVNLRWLLNLLDGLLLLLLHRLDWLRDLVCLLQRLDLLDLWDRLLNLLLDLLLHLTRNLLAHLLLHIC
jgi:hypothetical protein